jgi:hypothetical protein
MIIQCRHCHHPNDADAAYCDGCGLRLPDEAEREYQQHQPPVLRVGLWVRVIAGDYRGMVGPIMYASADGLQGWVLPEVTAYSKIEYPVQATQTEPCDRFDAAWKARRVAEEQQP